MSTLEKNKSENHKNTSPSQEQLRDILGHYQAGRLKDAEKLAISISQEFPNHQFAWKALGVIFAQTGRNSEAVHANQTAVSLSPQDAGAHSNLGNVLKELGRLDEALASYKQAIVLNPNFAEAHYNLGVTFKAQGRLDEALASYKQAIVLKSNYAEAHSNLGNVLKELGKLDEALASYKQAISLKPNFAGAHNNLGNVLKEIGKLDEAELTYKQAISLKPNFAEAHYNLSVIHLLQGNLDKGFNFYEWRSRKKEQSVAPARTKFIWDGKQKLYNKNFVVYEEQGLGDIIQFCRYLPLLEQEGADVTFKVKQVLHTILQTMPCSFNLSKSHPKESKIDFETPLMSLPNLFNTDLNSIPASIPYLYADSDRTKTWADRLSKDKFKIGICWQGSKSKIDFGRSFPLSNFKNISKLRNIELISLHKGEGEDQISYIDFDVTTLGPNFDVGQDAFIDTAAVMMNCDLIITSDTAVAHLSGALGCPTWVVLKYVPDWRWMLDRSDSPWYPTMALYRQKTVGNWVSIFEEIKHDLSLLMNQKGY